MKIDTHSHQNIQCAVANRFAFVDKNTLRLLPPILALCRSLFRALSLIAFIL